MRDNVLKKLEQFVSSVPDNEYSKTIAAISLFDFMDIMRDDDYPIDWLDRLTGSLQNIQDGLLAQEQTILFGGFEFSCNDDTYEDIAQQTGEVYFKLWRRFDSVEYFDKTTESLNTRFQLNGVDQFQNKSVLDAGCGSGRYSQALKTLGSVTVTGVDISPNSVEFAERHNRYPDAVKYVAGSVLDLPFDDDSFEFGFSNGVLHHTTDTQKGLTELSRVLQKGSHCWLYLYGGVDSFFWDIVDCCRKLLTDIPEEFCISVMQVLGYTPGRIFHRNDFFYVPIHRRYREIEVLEMLNVAGFVDIKRLHRGVQYDWDEIMHQKPTLDRYWFGEGEMRFLIKNK